MASSYSIALLEAAKAIPQEDYISEWRGPNHYLVLQNADIVRRVASQDRNRLRNVRRDRYAAPESPHKDADGMHVIYRFNGYEGLHISRSVAEDMIRQGVLVMTEPADLVQQDLHWSEDTWFQQYGKDLLARKGGPYMP